jgi:hypothetical protein
MIDRSRSQGITHSFVGGGMSAASIRGRTALVALLLTVVATACGPPRPMAIPGPGGRGGGARETGSSTTRAGAKDIRLDVKRVAGKEPPPTLIAEDGTRCIVTEGRFRETEIGGNALCAWRAP